MGRNLRNKAAAVVSLALCAVTAGAGAQTMRISVLRADSGNSIAIVSDGGASVVNSDPQMKDELMEGLDKLGANAKERNEVNLDKNMMSLAGRKGSRYADLSQKMDFISVRNYEFAQKGQYQKSDLEALKRKLEGNGWSHLVRNESDGETNDIVVKDSGDGFISDMVILNAEAKELNIVHLRGHFRMDDVKGAMGSAMGISMGSLGLSGHMSVSHSSSSSSSSSSTSPSSPPPSSPPPPAPPRR
jgi:hypothetical protein